MGDAALRSTARTTPMNDNAFGIRDGEIAIELPAKFDASLYFIGRIRTPWRRREDCEKCARVRRRLHPRGRRALGAGAHGGGDLQPPGGALLDEPLAA